MVASTRRRLARAATEMGSGEGADARAFPFALRTVTLASFTGTGFALAALAGWTRVRTRAPVGLVGAAAVAEPMVCSLCCVASVLARVRGPASSVVVSTDSAA
ncbi:hypothetical protein DFH11DRAFT_1620347 [Phellopilus nigrolimitatus]|nr:hypothetical protein DFH11DRAFT_1620347 [Phellopilus nigrolimitatus]